MLRRLGKRPKIPFTFLLFPLILSFMSRIYLNNDWDYCQAFLADLVKLDFTGEFDKVRLPHTFEVTPFNAFSTDIYQKNKRIT